MVQTFKCQEEYKINYWLEYFNKHAEKFFRVDYIRLFRFIELAYYITIFSLLTIVFGLIVNSFFPAIDNKKSSGIIVGEIIGQIILIGIVSFYINRFGNMFPFPTGQKFGYCPNNATQLGQAYVLAEAILFISTQTKLFGKVSLLVDRFEGVTTPP